MAPFLVSKGFPNTVTASVGTANHQFYAGFAGIKWDKWDKWDSAGEDRARPRSRAPSHSACRGLLVLVPHGAILAQTPRALRRTVVRGRVSLSRPRSKVAGAETKVARRSV